MKIYSTFKCYGVKIFNENKKFANNLLKKALTHLKNKKAAVYLPTNNLSSFRVYLLKCDSNYMYKTKPFDEAIATAYTSNALPKIHFHSH